MQTQSLKQPSKLKQILKCSFRLERDSGLSKIAGIDEVGRGCLAGPVVVAGVVFPKEIFCSDEPWIQEINDSKKLKAEKREELSALILKNARAAEIAWCTPEEIDSINILQATFKAAREVLKKLGEKLGQNLELILMDGSLKIPQITTRQHPIIGGDQISKSIAAASIVAKVYRDQWMERLGSDYPDYGFEKHKGYGTREHILALEEYGVTDIHRKSFLKKWGAVHEGKVAESNACRYLEDQSFKILDRNWKCAGAEIDIVAEKNREIHFVEVRFRSKEAELPLIFPESKQSQLKKAVDIYFMNHPELSKKPPHIHFLSAAPGTIEPFWDVFKF